MMLWYLDALRNYAQFSGSAHRRAFWMFVLIDLVAVLVVSMLDTVMGMGLLSTVYALALLIPRLAVAARRLHDIDRTGWWLLLFLVPVVGIAVLIFFWVQPGSAGENSYGPVPPDDVTAT